LGKNLLVGVVMANTYCHATGVRVRDPPITLEKLLAGLPDRGGAAANACRESPQKYLLSGWNNTVKTR